MDNLVDKVVRLQGPEGTYLVACDDRESVRHIKLDRDIAKQESAQWEVKRYKSSDRLLHFVSMYGKYLAFHNGKIIQWTGKGDSSTVRKWWLEERENGFPDVYVRISTGYEDVKCYLEASSYNYVSFVRYESRFKWWWEKLLCQWRIEVVKHPVTSKQQATISITQIGQYNDNGNTGKDKGQAGNQFSSNNSGCNTNGSGTQIIGGVTTTTKIGKQKAVFTNKFPK